MVLKDRERKRKKPNKKNELSPQQATGYHVGFTALRR